MPLTAALGKKELTVDPGAQASCEVRVKNTGRVVDEFRFEVLGDTAAWAIVEPPTVSLMPGTEGRVTVRFELPRLPTVEAGSTPFAVKVISHEDPRGSEVQEGVLIVGAFADTGVELIPRTARGRWSAKYELAVDNRGNTRVNAPLTPVDPDDQLRFAIHPPTVVAEPGAASFAKVVVRPRRRFLRGPDRTQVFRVLAETDAHAPIPADGTFLQEALIPRWVPRALAALAGVIVALLALWYASLRPAIRHEARKDAQQAVQRQLQSPQQQAKLADTARKAADDQLNKRLQQTPGTIIVQQPSSNALPGDPVINRLGGGAPTSFAVPGGQTLRLTDVVLENPRGESGAVELRRNSTVLFSLEAANFRDLDYHFVAPILFNGGDSVVLSAPTCGGCSVSYAGFSLKG